MEYWSNGMIEGKRKEDRRWKMEDPGRKIEDVR
jgi:hypothetical protein